MPLLVPTAAELAAMPWHARRRALTRANRILCDLLAMPEDTTRPDEPLTPGYAIRDEARALEAITPPDPDAGRHYATLAHVVYRRTA